MSASGPAAKPGSAPAAAPAPAAVAVPRYCEGLSAPLQESVSDAPAAVVHAVSEPPLDTRAYFRGRCLAKWPDSVVAANWDSMVFDVGRDPLRRVPMMEPLRGGAAAVARLIDESQTPAELLARLGG